MFPCKHCGKSYRSRSSLARHLHNHSIHHSRLACPTCDVVFSRRDVLTRHMQIHRGNSTATSSYTRRRCHTACLPCRVARVKCNGENPCLTCTANGLDCRFSNAASSYRVSRAMASQTDTAAAVPPDSSFLEEINDGHSQILSRRQASPPISTGTIEDVFSQPQPLPQDVPMTPSELPLPPSDDGPGLQAPSDALALLDSSGDSLVDLPGLSPLDMGLTWPGPISWPWLHESLYLQTSPLDDCFLMSTAAAAGPSFENAASTSCYPLRSANPSDQQVSPDVDCPGPSRLLTLPPASCSGTSGQPPLSTSQAASSARTDDQRSSRSGIHSRHQQPEVSNSLADRSAAQARVVEELTTYATRREVEAHASRTCYWHSMSLQVAETFRIGDWRTFSSEPALMRMIRLYRVHFSPLWPLLSGGDSLDPAPLHPLLFLTLASIGAMYGTPQERCFGTAMHEGIRDVLAAPLFDLEKAEENLLPLGQARLLTQVAALYFGQRRAFTYAQHLGAIILAQARRMDLFSGIRTPLPVAKSPDKIQARGWLNMEARKRLAYGILRADVYTSVLLNSKPLVSPEEINIDLPVPDHIWSAPDEAVVRKYREWVIANPSQWRNLAFNDLVRIAFDRSEALLDMEPTSYELLLFGLQEPVWRFSHDPSTFTRLTGTPGPPLPTPDGWDQHQPTDNRRDKSSRQPPLDDQLGMARRRMSDLQDDRSRLIDALQKWERSFTAVRTTNIFEHDRTSIMSSLLLFQITYLRLAAPLADLHSVAYALSNRSNVDHGTLQMITRWSRSLDARLAADLACRIWGLLDQETMRPAAKRAKHNLLAFTGLHHAAVVLWTYAGCQDQGSTGLTLPVTTDGGPIKLCRHQSTKLLLAVVDLFRRLTPVGWCSFAVAAEHLSLSPFPVTAHGED